MAWHDPTPLVNHRPWPLPDRPWIMTASLTVWSGFTLLAGFAPAIYKALDFAPLYVRPRYYPDGESAVVMVRELAQS